MRCSTVDANYKVISTDINASDAGSGALINLKGEVVGLMLQSYSTREAQSTMTAISISQISKLLEKMSNGESPAYLGLEICTVTAEIAKSNELPKAYISNRCLLIHRQCRPAFRWETC